MAIIDSIKDKLGNIIYPKTLTKAIYEEVTNKRLDNKLAEMDSDIATIALNTDLVTHKAENVQQGNPHGISWGSPITATLENGWTGTLTYRKNGLNQLWIMGAITAPAAVTVSVITKLAVGYRPANFTPIGVVNTTTNATLPDNIDGQTYEGIVQLRKTHNISSGNVIRFNTIIQC